MNRLFIATFLNEAEKDLLGSLLGSSNAFVSADKWHLTWMFLGDCNKELEAETLQILEETASNCKSQNIAYDKFSIWPSSMRPRVGVLESSTAPSEFIDSVEQMQKKLAPLLTNPGEQHAHFKPHITIARFKNKSNDEIQFKSENLPLIQALNEVALVKSDFKSYKIIEKFSLRQE